IATSLGVIAGLSLPVLGVLTLLGVLIIILTRYVSLASLTGAAIFPLLLWFLRETSRIEVTPLVILLSTLLALLAILRHRDNIKRLLKGQENKVGKKVNILH
ncbi:glycerol-3-phosphate acyltransferase, partial [candidate division NPL-UPA2 bacterium]|nr:glycerol-3-phosphate acyltransferase [candidate division NPL-UPA2 bacterium]